MAKGGSSVLAWLGARLWFCYLRWCQRTSSFVFPPATEACLGNAGLPATPRLFVYWHDETLLLSMLGGGAGLAPPSCAPSDGLGGRILGAVWRRLGGGLAWMPRHSSREVRLARMERSLRKTMGLALAADQGAPRFAVRATPWQLARRVEGTRVIALHLEASSELRLFGLRLPLPYSSFSLGASGPFDAAGTLAEFRLTLHAALQALRDPDRVPTRPVERAPLPSPEVAAPVRVGPHRAVRKDVVKELQHG